MILTGHTTAQVISGLLGVLCMSSVPLGPLSSATGKTRVMMLIPEQKIKNHFRPLTD